MSTIVRPASTKPIAYPESDGRPRAEITLQFQWIVTVKEGLAVLYRDRPDVFVAGDLLWYPVEGEPGICAAPDAMVAFGRPPGYRGSYLQWKEDDIPPQVVFEILSPGNRVGEMVKKYRFYEQFGVLEYYLYDPEHNDLDGWHRPSDDQPLAPIPSMANWSSPRLGITFDWTPAGLRLIRPDGRPFETFEEVSLRADQAETRADQERQRAERLAARLRELGEDLG